MLSLARDGAAADAALDPALTWVELVHYAERIERWVRFGRAAEERIVDRRRRWQGFAPGAVFAYVRWQANDRGTVISRLVIVQAVERQHAHTTTPGLRPGGDLLLRLIGWPKVQRAFAAIDAVEQLGVDPADAAPDYWRQLHNRISARREPEPYTVLRHRAWRQRAELAS
jgi:hypothetical protein